MAFAPWWCCCDACSDCAAPQATATVTLDGITTIVGQTGPGGDPDAGNFVSAGCLRANGRHGFAFANWSLSAGDPNGTWTLARGPDVAGDCFYAVVVDGVFSATDTEDDSFFSDCASGTASFTFTRFVVEARRRLASPGGVPTRYWEVVAYLGTGAGPSGGHADTPEVYLFGGDSLAAPGTCAADAMASAVTSFETGYGTGLSLGRGGTATLTTP